LTLFFDISVEKAILRTNSRTDAEAIKNRMDAETTEFYERVRAAYLQIAETEKNRFQVIDANGSVEEIKTKVLEIVTEFLGK
jgi:dTMP kinase